MDDVLQFLQKLGYRVLAVRPNLVTIHLVPMEMTRATALLRESLLAVGVELHESKKPIERPCAWVEFDVATVTARLFLVLNDECLPRGRAAREEKERAAEALAAGDALTP